MLTRRTFIAAMAAAALLRTLPSGATEPATVLIEVIIDNGGTVTEEDAPDLIRAFFANLADAPGRAFRDARIDLITTARPYTVWSGTPEDLYAHGREVLELTALTDHCSDLGRAFGQAEQNLRVGRPTEAHLFVVSPLIDARYPCDAGPGITLPQPVPPDLPLARMVVQYSIRTLGIFGVHPSQEAVWTDYLDDAGVLGRGRSGQLDLVFLGFSQSQAYLARHRLFERED
ncbi:MAG: hypothetical protein H6843_00895 [Rhodospirillaceae bacterium]|nr:hypothetical protein [Rhodospirillaceae bacterium]